MPDTFFNWDSNGTKVDGRNVLTGEFFLTVATEAKLLKAYWDRFTYRFHLKTR